VFSCFRIKQGYGGRPISLPTNNLEYQAITDFSTPRHNTSKHTLAFEGAAPVGPGNFGWPMIILGALGSILVFFT
jgi:hypothetical protein